MFLHNMARLEEERRKRRNAPVAEAPIANTMESLAYDTVAGMINEGHRFGQKAMTGEDYQGGDLINRPPLEGDAKKISAAIGETASFIANYRGIGNKLRENGVSIADAASFIANTYNKTLRPTLINAIGEPGTNHVEGGLGLLSMIGIPGKKTVVKAGLDDGVQNADVTARPTRAKKRVGTTGQYVGAPPGIDSPQKLAAMRKRYIKDVMAGLQSRDWYTKGSEFTDRVAPPGRSQQVANVEGITSQGTAVDPNLGHAVKGINQRAAGLPVDTGRFPNNQSALIEESLDGGSPFFGNKRTPYAQNLSVTWNPAMAKSPVHDIWQGRSFGYPGDKPGKPFDRGFSDTEHAFLDEQMALIAEQLNKQKAGGFDDWDALNTQAAAWTGARIKAGEVSPDDSSLGYGDYSEKYQAAGTYEQTPGAGTGQFPALIDAPFDERQAFDDAATWENTKGQDSIYSEGGMLAEPTGSMVGAYTPEGTGVLEINPGRVARPLVQQKDGVINVSDGVLLDVAESSRAYVDVQNAGAWHKIIPNSQTKAGERTGINVPLNESPNEAMMRDISKLAEEEGFFAVDTGKGINFISDSYLHMIRESKNPNSKGHKLAVELKAKNDSGEMKWKEVTAAWEESDFNRTGTSLGQDLKKNGLALRINNVTGGDVKRVKIQTGYEDYEKAWAAGEGSRKATEKFFENAERNEAFFKSIEPALRQKARANLARDIDRAERTGDAVRPDIMERNRILADEGYPGLKRAFESGALLPAAILAVLSPALLSSSDDDQSRETF